MLHNKNKNNNNKYDKERKKTNLSFPIVFFIKCPSPQLLITDEH